MDILSGLLDGPRADGAFLLRSVFEPPWSLRIRDRAPLSVVVIARGRAWVVPTEGDPVRLDRGDLVLVRGPAPYTVADDPQTPPQVFVEPGQVCTDASGRSLSAEMMLGLRTWGNATDGATTMVTGTYERASAVSERLLRALPETVVLRGDAWSSDLVTLLCTEMQRDVPGQEVFLDRLLDLVVLSAVRTWLNDQEDAAPGWYRAATDPVVGPALQALHLRVADPWTVGTLAAEVQVSRAVLARRFASVVGEPPMAYLTSLRLALAADLLERTDRTLTSIAHEVGYASPFALSAAFSRERGVSPTAYRSRTRGLPPA
ncbi:AraC family transcriptional regulator [Mumia sp. zg.B17]|uniref:AraC family transcriptional regulator n=1 Tax=Mumia sp. zg.B17 TaxID=2855446 RepID=UPI001C6EFC21|nr:AraC family transcriptional regulator [Mumia sp. zg.B17]MBW9207808.1 AraC family transcriptional regulator [Mumia sp. zg.B17]